MISLQRKMMLRGQADAAYRASVTAARVGRTGQVVRATVPVGEDDLPVVEVAQDAVNAASELPGVQDGVDSAGADAWESWEQSDYAKTLAQQLDVELTAAQADLVQALADAQTALTDAGLARSEAAQAVSDAAAAAADAAQAVADALAASEKADKAAPHWDTVDPVAADATGRPVGALWWVRDGAGTVVKMWELTALGWVQRPLNETLVPQIMIGSGTYGLLQGNRLVAKSVTAAQIQALTITANEMAANAVTAVKIAADAVTAEKISSGAVTTVKLDALAVTAEKLAVGAVVAEKIAAGAITAGKIAATAIDGMTITGAVIRTAPNGQRVQFDASGVSAYNSSNAVTAALSASSGGMRLIGSLELSSSLGGTSPWTYINEYGVSVAEQQGGGGAGAMTLPYEMRVYRGGSGTVRMSVANSATSNESPSVQVSTDTGGSGSLYAATPGFGTPNGWVGLVAFRGDLQLTSFSDKVSIAGPQQVFVNSTQKILLSSSNLLELDAPTIKFRGDTGWTDLTPVSPFSIYDSTAVFMVKRINGVAYLTGALTCSTAGHLTSTTARLAGTLPVSARPPSDQNFVCQGSGMEKYLLNVKATGAISISRYTGTQNAGVWLPFAVNWAI